MYKREKLLIAVLDELWHKKRMDKILIHKIMFLFAMEKKIPFSFYGFFPYKYGPWSYKITRDLEYFKKKNYITDSLHLTENGKENIQISPSQQYFLRELLKKYPKTKDLVDYVYNNYPKFTINSIAFNKRSKVDMIPEDPKVFLIGYEKRPIDDFFNLLIQNGVRKLIDIRINPTSMNYEYNHSYIQKVADICKIEYLKMNTLGVPSEIRKENKEKNGDNSKILEIYEKEILPKKNEEFQILREMGKKERIALLCYEKSASDCHRGVVGNHLIKEGIRVESIE